MIFKSILVAIITPVHTKKSFHMGLELAKKLESELTVVECVYKIPPKFYFFETGSDKKQSQKQVAKAKEELEKWKKIAEGKNVKIKTKFAITESIADWVIEYVKDHHIDLLIVDYPKVSKIEATIFDDIIHMIHEHAHCAVLTAKH
jgi:nucleotide-binding universal stress UspA family protein